MKAKSIISELHLKFAEKNWNETFQLVRRCMDKPRDESKPCESLTRSLEMLQQVFNVSSLNTVKSRLETIAKQQRMGFHITEATCYLTADLFYLEVVLLPCGEVKEVQVAPHRGSPVPSQSLLQLLRLQDFSKFSSKLADLYTQYNIPGDNDLKLKLFSSLQWLGNDLQQISELLMGPKDFNTAEDTINNGRIGCLIAGKEDCPLTIQFYIDPADAKTSDESEQRFVIETKNRVHTAQVTVGVSDVTHRLQISSVMVQPAQLDPRGFPVFLPLSEASYEVLPACFLLRLQPQIPVTASLVKQMSQITDVAIPDADLQWVLLPKLLMSRSGATSQQETLVEQEAIFTESLPGGEMHSFIFPEAAWDDPALKAAAVDGVPFTHPTHIPALLELLRHGCVINTLLRSCFSPQSHVTGSGSDLHCEVLPESESSFTVTFQQPHTDSLAVLLVNTADFRHISCTLFGAGAEDPSMNEHLSTVLMRSMSIPVTLRTLYSQLQEITSAPLSPRSPATTEAQNGHLSLSSATMTDTSGASTSFSQSASVPEDGFSVSGSACYALSVSKSELLPEINPSPAVSPLTLTPPVGVFPPWLSSEARVSDVL